MMNQIIRYKTIINFIKKYKPDSVLEIGSGSQGIGKFMRNLKFTGLDKTTSDYGTEEKKTAKNMSFISGSSLDIALPDSSFDFVFSLDMLEHIEPKDRLIAVKEVMRVSKKYSIIGFPYGGLGTLVDNLFYQHTLIKDGEVEGWLKEHVENGLPTEQLITDVKAECHTQGLSINEITSGNVFFVILILNLESKRYICTLLNILSHIVNYLPLTFDSPYGVRKYLIIKNPNA